MVNAWSLLYSEMNGTMDEDYPIMSKDDTLNVNVPIGTASPDTIHIDTSDLVGAADTVTIGSGILGGMGSDHIDFGGDLDFSSVTSNYPYTFGDDTFLAGSLGEGAEQDKPKPNLKNGSTHKYQEDKGIADLKSYVASTYQGHYTNENSDVQTLDLIHSVGDAESFCRSNALKYLSRYDKKGSAKNDILKAMHYCLLLYYFSGNTQEPDYTNTRYETF